MGRFRFPLEPLLEMRYREERMRMKELGEIEAQRSALEVELRAKQQELGLGRDSLRGGLVGRVNVDLLRQQAAATLAVDRLARRTVLQLAGLSQRADEARGRLVEASQRRRAVEILRERRLDEWKREGDRKEVAFLDDLSNIVRANSSFGGESRDDASANRGVSTP